MKTILLIALIGLAACSSNSTGTNSQSQSGYLGVWYQRDVPNWQSAADTLNFTGLTSCTMTCAGHGPDGVDSWSPSVETMTGDSVLFQHDIINADAIGKTVISLSWLSRVGGTMQYVNVYLGNDSLLSSLPPDNAPPGSIIFTR